MTLKQHFILASFLSPLIDDMEFIHLTMRTHVCLNIITPYRLCIWFILLFFPKSLNWYKFYGNESYTFLREHLKP